ncbi:Uncharacterised protein [Chlamydia abortus]|nr:Uncharacterised protein [Chlamydia abortus]
MALAKFYCVECNHLISEENAGSIFRTGFYRRGVPLGQCRECRDNNTSHVPRYTLTDTYSSKLG